MVDRNAAAADEVAAAIGGVAVDARPHRPGDAIERLDADVDILVNNAGFQHVAPLPEFPPDTFAAIQRVMVEAPFRLVRRALPHMYERGWGRVVNDLLGARAARVAVQVGLRHGQARRSRGCPR